MLLTKLLRILPWLTLYFAHKVVYNAVMNIYCLFNLAAGAAASKDAMMSPQVLNWISAFFHEIDKQRLLEISKLKVSQSRITWLVYYVANKVTEQRAFLTSYPTNVGGEKLLNCRFFSK